MAAELEYEKFMSAQALVNFVNKHNLIVVSITASDNGQVLYYKEREQ
mgnify:CR=1 FL=1